MPWRATLLLLLSAWSTAHGVAAQRAVKVSDAWVTTSPGPDTTAFVRVENGTMYDVYIVGAESPVADAVELMQKKNGELAAAKEVAVAAFDSLAMSPDGIFLRLRGLKRPMKNGDSAEIAVVTDQGDRLTVSATVKE